MRRFRLVALLLVATALSPVRISLGDEPLRGVALVIGESDYAVLADLPNPHRDARALDNLLGDLGFDVSRVLDGDADELREEIAEFIEDAADADVALIYYSGHGVELGGQNYLVPTDTDLSTPEAAGQSLVAVEAMLNELARVVPVTILLLDACRTDAFPAGQMFTLPGEAAPVAVGGPGLEAVRGPTPIGRPGTPDESLGMVIGFAASPGQAALDGEPGGNSPYAAAIVKHFSAGGYSLADLMTMVGEEVYLETQARQLPWVNASLRRVLTFGEPMEAAGDEALIREGRRSLLMSIATAPETTRRFVETMAERESLPLDALYGMLKVLGIGTEQGSIEAQLQEGAARLKSLMESRTGATLYDSELQRLAALADKAEAEGAMDVALGFREQASARADVLELRVDENEANLEQDRLQIGATYAEHATTATLNFDHRGAIEMWRKAVEQVEGWDETLTAGYRNNLGVALMWEGRASTDVGLLAEAAALFEASLKVFDKADAVDWARTQSNLGSVLQMLGDREYDPGRYYAAAESHRAALAILTRDSRPSDWATAQMNLGIALARIGEGEQGVGTLEEAVAALEAALEVHTREAAPAQWAALNDNLGSALSSLARKTNDPALLGEGIDAFRRSLEGRGPGSEPMLWAMTQRNLGLALKTYGVMSGDVQAIVEGADAYRAALQVFTPDRAPMDFAQVSAVLGIALMEIAAVEPSVALLEEAWQRFADAREVLGPMNADQDAYFAGRLAQIDEMLGR